MLQMFLLPFAFFSSFFSSSDHSEQSHSPIEQVSRMRSYMLLMLYCCMFVSPQYGLFCPNYIPAHDERDKSKRQREQSSSNIFWRLFWSGILSYSNLTKVSYWLGTINTYNLSMPCVLPLISYFINTFFQFEEVNAEQLQKMLNEKILQGRAWKVAWKH